MRFGQLGDLVKSLRMPGRNGDEALVAFAQFGRTQQIEWRRTFGIRTRSGVHLERFDGIC